DGDVRHIGSSSRRGTGWPWIGVRWISRSTRVRVTGPPSRPDRSRPGDVRYRVDSDQCPFVHGPGSPRRTAPTLPRDGDSAIAVKVPPRHRHGISPDRTNPSSARPRGPSRRAPTRPSPEEIIELPQGRLLRSPVEPTLRQRTGAHRATIRARRRRPPGRGGRHRTLPNSLPTPGLSRPRVMAIGAAAYTTAFTTGPEPSRLLLIPYRLCRSPERQAFPWPSAVRTRATRSTLRTPARS